MLYAVKCYWPGVTETEVERIVERATWTGPSGGRGDAEYLGSLLFADDELVLCLFEGTSRAAVKQASDRAGIPCERLMDSMWLATDSCLAKGLPQ